MNLVAQAFDGDVEKAVAWFKARNPLLGDVSPRDMIRLGRYERLRKFIIAAMMGRVVGAPAPAAPGASCEIGKVLRAAAQGGRARGSGVKSPAADGRR
jgi:hypothetical protein